jgi:hypothetical protein
MKAARKQIHKSKTKKLAPPRHRLVEPRLKRRLAKTIGANSSHNSTGGIGIRWN